VGDRSGEQFVSPTEQAERIRTACERDGLRLVDTLEELDISGGAPLERRPGLRRAVEMVEAGSPGRQVRRRTRRIASAES